jgi:hypothetical protein
MYSLYGDACEWYSSLPPSCISSLKEFHEAFNERCKKFFPDEFLYDNCCEEFSSFHKVFACHKDQVCDKAFIVEEDIYHANREMLKDNSNMETSDIISDVSVILNIDQNQQDSFGCIGVKESMHIAATKSSKSESTGESEGEQIELDTHEEHVVVEDTLHYDQEISDSPHDNLRDAFDIVSNVSTVVRCHNDQFFSLKTLKMLRNSDLQRMKRTAYNFHICRDCLIFSWIMIPNVLML